MSKLTGKKAIITGASRGIGLAIAKAFAANGASQLLLVGRNANSLSSAVKNIKHSTSSCDINTYIGDIKERNSWVEIGKLMKDVDILINSAGISHSSLLATTSPNFIEEIIQTNLMGTIWGCQIISKLMMRQHRAAENTGCIINISSLLGMKGGRGSAVYAASKAGVIGLTRSISQELTSSNIRVNALVPGYIETLMTDEMQTESRTAALSAIPQGRFGTPEEIADAALFLASNPYANNSILNLDGGLSAT